MGHGRRQAAQVGAQRVERVSERARLVLPVGGQRQAGQIVDAGIVERERQLGTFWHGVADASTSRHARQAVRVTAQGSAVRSSSNPAVGPPLVDSGHVPVAQLDRAAAF